MYSCQVCDKSYQLRSSLTRHLRNHSVSSSQHVCPTCDVAFSRRDLLRRHSQIHSRPENSSDCNEASSSAPRQRCHTACQPCREARVKCNGEYPCAQCVSNKTECQFQAARTHRVSRVVEIDAVLVESEANPDDGAMGNDDGALSDTQPEPVISAGPDMLQSPVSNMNSPTICSFGPADSTLDPGHADQVTEMDLSWENTLPGTTTGSWPWLHESLFLQGDAMLDWPDEFGASPLDQLGIVQDSSLNAMLDISAQVAARPAPSPAKSVTFGSPFAASVEPTEQEERAETRQSNRIVTPDSRFQTVLQEQLVEELVACSGNHTVTPGSQLSRYFYWQSISLRVAEAFQFDSCPSGDSKPSLFRMIHMYKEKFSPLWPLLSGKDLDPNHLHPLLFLTVVSIGCMYGTPRECKFGNRLHEHIRRHLAESLIGLEDGEGDILWLGQARLLTQVAALYFGQRRGFSYAQHLGAILIAQARRMDLFSTLGSSMARNVPVEQQLAVWHNYESRKRLAFGILRADVFASVLLNTRPLLSAEEIYLDFPGDDDLWMDLDKISQEQLVARLRAEPTGTLGLPFCDLVRVAKDRDEVLLNMNARGYELLIFGLQDHVWRFSHDRTMFPRLTGQSDGTISSRTRSACSSSPDRRLSISVSSQSDHLGITFRQMDDLRVDRSRITKALQKWEQSFAAIRTMQRFTKDRSSMMSSLLLLQISYLRLCAPLTDLHSVAYALMDKKSFDEKKLHALYEWARGPEMTQSMEHVRQIWSLLHCEINRSDPEKAKYNLLAFLGLHHAAVVIWAFAGAHQEPISELPDLPGWENMAPIPLRRDCNETIFRHVVSLYKRLIPRGWYSFAAAAEHLAAHPFP